MRINFLKPNTQNRKKRALFTIFSLAIVSCCYTQTTYHFTKGLLLTAGSRYGREAIYTDPLAYKLYTNTLKRPVDGDSFDVNQRGQVIKWQAITADSLNRLRRSGGFGGGGYIYLDYNSPKERIALLNIKGNNSLIFNGESHAGDPYGAGYLFIPVKLKKGINDIYVRGQNIVADLIFPEKPLLLNTDDPTLPFIVPGNSNDDLMGAIVLINASPKAISGLQVKTTIGGKEMTNPVAPVPAMSARKIIFHFNGAGATTKGQHDCLIQLMENGKVLDKKNIPVDAVDAGDKYSVTFISDIDGSLQYFAVTPQTGPFKPNAALFLSVHGAGVEAIGQARAYQSKDWGNLVAATNRRPRGFNWEDWGRLDALEVLEMAKSKFKPDPKHIYLTGHSMGGHGTWFLGATYPDKWAAIAPCAGYPTLKGYGSADGLIPDSSNIPMEQLLLRSGNQSDVLKMVSNYKPLGIYIHHGDADPTVSVNYARQMRKILGEFHADMSYHEQPGGSHWFGSESVDWAPIFEFFKWHKIADDTAVNTIDFMTANPGISADYRWAGIEQQLRPLQFSRIQLKRSRSSKAITGTTDNVRVLRFNLEDFSSNDQLTISLDGGEGLKYTVKGTNENIYLLKDNNKWNFTTAPGPDQKGPHRYGTLKDAFNHRMVFVYGTTGTKEENEWSFTKARFDAETWLYRGNGAVDIVPDKEFSIEKYKDRGVIIYGNKTTNAAYKLLLTDCPIQVERNKITAAGKAWQGDDLASYLVWPIKGSSIASVAVIAGTGLRGMNAATANQYFAGASGFPDFMIFGIDLMQKGPSEVKMTGFYDNNWKLEGKDFEIAE